MTVRALCRGGGGYGWLMARLWAVPTLPHVPEAWVSSPHAKSVPQAVTSLQVTHVWCVRAHRKTEQRPLVTRRGQLPGCCGFRVLKLAQCLEYIHAFMKMHTLLRIGTFMSCGVALVCVCV